MGTQTTDETEVRERDQLEALRLPLEQTGIDILEQRIEAHQGELCICCIWHNYTTRELHVHKFLGNYNDSDYSTHHHSDLYLLLWQANSGPAPQADGKFLIPAEKHVGVESDFGEWFHGAKEYGGGHGHHTPNRLDYREGNVQHHLLTNHPFGLAPDFAIPDQQTPSGGTAAPEFDDDDFEDYTRLLGGPQGTWATFHIGSASAFEYLCGITWNNQRLLQMYRAIGQLGCESTGEFQELVATATRELKAAFRKRIIKALAEDNSEEARKLQREYKLAFNENINSIPII